MEQGPWNMIQGQTPLCNDGSEVVKMLRDLSKS